MQMNKICQFQHRLFFGFLFNVNYRQKQTSQSEQNYYQMQHNTIANPQPTNDHQVKHRTKNHQAILKLKEADKHIQMMKRRFKYLQVRDEEYRSKTIQHQQKLLLHDARRQSMKKDRIDLQKSVIMREAQVEKYKQKNMALKEDISKNIEIAKEKVYEEKQKDYQMGRAQHEKNEEKVKEIKERDYEQKQGRRKVVNQMQQVSKANVDRFKESRYKQLLDQKANDCSSVLSIATERERQLEKLARYEEQLIKKSSQSMQTSQMMRNRLRQVLGDERRFTKLPSIRNKGNYSTRGSTGHTQIISI